ncbi:MAG: hypothetical protein J5879_02245 [Clostridia bacterium]|nr:hypothetical protein [Clostridia bacterium]
MPQIRNYHSRLCLTDTAAVFFLPDEKESVCLYGAEEFVVYVRENGRINAVFSTLTEKTKTEQTADRITLSYSHGYFDAEVCYAAKEDAFYKTVKITQKKDGVEITRVCTESRKCSLRLFRGGEGQPVFAQGENICFFCGCESPAAANLYNDNVLNFTQAPFSGEKTVGTVPVSYGIARGKAFDAFSAHIKRAAIRTKPYRVYSDWALRDDLTPSDPVLSESLTLSALDAIESFTKKSGVRFDTYLMDAFWFEDKVPYTEFRRSAFPHGIGAVLRRAGELGLDFGLWFDINGLHTHLYELDEYRSYDSMLGNHALCLACGGTAEMLYNGIKKQIQDCKIKAIKLDFGYFECKNPAHRHSTHPDEYKEKAVLNFIKVIDRLRLEEPDLKVLCYNGWTTSLDHIGSISEKPGYPVSPYWCLYVDYVYCGDPRPSETPLENVADSVAHYTDAMFYGFCEAGMPQSNIDDDGVMVGSTGTIYRQGRKTFRRGILSSVMRGTRKLHFYGDLTLLNDGDVRFFSFADSLFERTSGYGFSLLPGDPRKNEMYGYRADSENDGYALIFAPEPYDAYYPLYLPDGCETEVLVENGEILKEKKRLPENGRGVFVQGGGYTLVHYTKTRQNAHVTAPEGCELPGCEAYAHGELFEIPLLPGDLVSVDTKGFRRLQLMFKGENGEPLRLPTGRADGIGVFSGEDELRPENTEIIWSGISHVRYDVSSRDAVTVKNEGTTVVKMKYRRLRT